MQTVLHSVTMSAERDQAIAEGYIEGTSADELAETHDVARATVYAALRRTGTPTRTAQDSFRGFLTSRPHPDAEQWQALSEAIWALQRENGALEARAEMWRTIAEAYRHALVEHLGDDLAGVRMVPPLPDL